MPLIPTPNPRDWISVSLSRGMPFPILHFNPDGAIFASDTYYGGLGSGVTMNVRQTLLNKPKYQQFHIRREPPEFVADAELNIQTAPLSKTFNVPTQSLEGRSRIFVSTTGCCAVQLAIRQIRGFR
jgi:hypothetical protein